MRDLPTNPPQGSCGSGSGLYLERLFRASKKKGCKGVHDRSCCLQTMKQDPRDLASRVNEAEKLAKANATWCFPSPPPASGAPQAPRKQEEATERRCREETRPSRSASFTHETSSWGSLSSRTSFGTGAHLRSYTRCKDGKLLTNDDGGSILFGTLVAVLAPGLVQLLYAFPTDKESETERPPRACPWVNQIHRLQEAISSRVPRSPFLP